ncbi:metal ABC transporter permease [Caldalkalibacillus mannanilyticus]|uniref:metal ABC transporter permease n=1 Tax=Caldalkalibacillus mannanilyticus TaxID=1418 RepID=UPI0004685D02|nr:metal ABC transporter permease [Caldalkalibacillus mannanilyticus]
MIELLFDLEFIRRGIIAGLIVGFICPIIGSFLVVRRLSLISEALSHITLTGVAFGMLFAQTWIVFQGVDPLYFGLLFAFLGAFFIERVRRIFKHYQELSIPILLSVGIGLGVVLMSMANGFNAGLLHFLFGSIVSVTAEDLLFVLIASVIVFSLFLLFYKEFLSIAFDEEFAKISGIPKKWIHLLFSLLVALTISIAMKVVGILLVSSMMTIPVAASLKIAKSFKQVILYAVLIAESSMISGMIVGYYLEIATGGMVVVSAILHLGSVLLYQKLKQSSSREVRS